MPKTLFVLIVAMLPFAAQRGQEQQIVRAWMQNIQSHEPGTVDRPLRDVANQPPRSFDLVCLTLHSTLSQIKNVRERNDIRRRGALLHTDIAMLLPDRAADFTQEDLVLTMRTERPFKPDQARAATDSVILSSDGEYLSSAIENAHWWMASYLLRGIQPNAGEDPFVAGWSRAVTAYFESRRSYGSADHHLRRAFIVLPDDPVLLFYSGTLHETYASARVQSVPSTSPTSRVNLSSPADEWRQAEKYFRDSVKRGGRQREPDQPAQAGRPGSRCRVRR